MILCIQVTFRSRRERNSMSTFYTFYFSRIFDEMFSMFVFPFSYSFKHWNYKKSTWTGIYQSSFSPVSRCKEVSRRLSKTLRDEMWKLQFCLVQHSLRVCLKSLLKVLCSNEFNGFSYKSCCASILANLSNSFLYRYSQDVYIDSFQTSIF